jgi:hypothetical protein
LYECGFETDILPIVMPSAATRKVDPCVLGSFENKRVRICAHNDEPGIAAARGWQDQLETVVGAIVDIWVPPKIRLSDGSSSKDLDDIFWKLSPDIRGELREVHELINLEIRLFPAHGLSKQG